MGIRGIRNAIPDSTGRVGPRNETRLDYVREFFMTEALIPRGAKPFLQSLRVSLTLYWGRVLSHAVALKRRGKRSSDKKQRKA